MGEWCTAIEKGLEGGSSVAANLGHTLNIYIEGGQPIKQLVLKDDNGRGIAWGWGASNRGISRSWPRAPQTSARRVWGTRGLSPDAVAIICYAYIVQCRSLETGDLSLQGSI